MAAATTGISGTRWRSAARARPLGCMQLDGAAVIRRGPPRSDNRRSDRLTSDVTCNLATVWYKNENSAVHASAAESSRLDRRLQVMIGD